jgi:hypothetical protein
MHLAIVRVLSAEVDPCCAASELRAPSLFPASQITARHDWAELIALAARRQLQALAIVTSPTDRAERHVSSESPWTSAAKPPSGCAAAVVARRLLPLQPDVLELTVVRQRPHAS